VGAPDSAASGLTPAGRRVLDAIECLPEDEREAFDLVAIQGLTQGEAAAVVGVSEKTVRRLNRAQLLADLRPDTPRGPEPPTGDTPAP
jgi:RNA polymerase sigma-70 factor (ECF subfamily)